LFIICASREQVHRDDARKTKTVNTGAPALPVGFDELAWTAGMSPVRPGTDRFMAQPPALAPSLVARG